jgi:choline kinase
MKAVMLAAGVGSRLYGDDGTQPPKSLLQFDGKTLLRRHVDILKSQGVESLTLVVGYRKELLLAEIQAMGASDYVTPIFNPDFRDGPVVSFWLAREAMTTGSGSLFMDADVLYHPSLIARLIAAPNPNCFLFDRHLDPGVDPVRLCIKGGVPVEIGKMVEGEFDQVGEWPGFLKFSPAIARKVCEVAERQIKAGQNKLAYEPAMREVLMSEPRGTFGFEDISDVPWIEIDFPEDLERAKGDILTRIRAMG